MIRAGYVVLSKDTYYFNGLVYRPNTGAGRPSDLDYIVCIPESRLFVGVQVKNKLEHPTYEEVSSLLDICHALHLRPVLLARLVHPNSFGLLKSNGGWAIKFKMYFKRPPFPRTEWASINDMGIPLGVYQFPPQFLVDRLLAMKDQLVP